VAVKEKEKDKEAAPLMEAVQTTDALPPQLDLPDATVKKLIRIAKKRGYVTHDQVKSLSEELNSRADGGRARDVLRDGRERGRA
jgi:RNA polymerase primary sigma factor